LRAIRAGASGYVTKNGAADELVTAIRTIVDGRHYLSPWLAERLAREATGDASKAPHEQLSDREVSGDDADRGGQDDQGNRLRMNISPKTVARIERASPRR